MEAHRDAPTRPGFFAALGVVVGALVRNAGTCAALAAPPALLIGAAAGTLRPLSGLDEGGSFAAVVAAGAVGTAAAGTLVLAGAVAYPLAAAGLAWVGVRAVDGERTRPGEALGRLIDRGPSAVGAFLLAALAVVAAPLVLGVLALVAGAGLGEAAAGMLLIPLIASLVWPAFVYWVRFGLAVPVVVAEGRSPSDALGRSVELVRGGFWWVTGIFVLTAVAASVVGSLLSAPFGAGGSPVGFAFGQAVSVVVSMAAAGVAVGVVYGVRRIPEEAPEPTPVGAGAEEPTPPDEEWPGPGI